jgi:2-aminoethylphosphonate transport system substrate-binding protein
MKRHTLLRAATMTAACGGTGSSSGSGETVTVYSADGLANWYKPQFDKFTKDTGIAVNLVEAGSGEVVSRVGKEQSNPQADLLVTLPPFIQKADKSGLLVASGADTKGNPRRSGRAGRELRADRQQRVELHRQSQRQPAAQDVGRPAGAAVQG